MVINVEYRYIRFHQGEYFNSITKIFFCWLAFLYYKQIFFIPVNGTRIILGNKLSDNWRKKNTNSLNRHLCGFFFLPISTSFCSLRFDVWSAFDWSILKRVINDWFKRIVKFLQLTKLLIAKSVWIIGLIYIAVSGPLQP